MRSSLVVALAAAAGMSTTSSVSAAPIVPAISGNTQFDAWDTPNLSTATNQGYGAFPGTAPWPGPIESKVAGSGDAVLMKAANGLSGGPLPLSGSLYFGSFGGGHTFGGTLSISDATPVAALRNVILQIDIGEADGDDFFNDVLPVLSYNAGAQNLAPSNSGVVNRISTGVISTPGGDVEIFRNTWLVQWDLSSAGPVGSFDVRFSAIPHTQVYNLRLDQADVFAPVAVPEPASLSLLALAASTLMLRKRR